MEAVAMAVPSGLKDASVIGPRWSEILRRPETTEAESRGPFPYSLITYKQKQTE